MGSEPSIMTGRSNLAVFIDADNTSKESIKSILDACARYGRVIIKRAYGDWTSNELHGWSTVFREFAIKPIQQFRFIDGKNVTDSAMIIDAMDILHSKDADLFVLVSSDSDFTGLATRIREEGLEVIGVGRKLAPPAFVNACDKFLLLENLISEPVDKGKTKSKKSGNEKNKLSKSVIDQGRELLIRGINAVQDENGVAKGAPLSTALRRLDPSFDPKNIWCFKILAISKIISRNHRSHDNSRRCYL